MKQKIVSTKHAKEILQVYGMKVKYSKEEKSYNDRRGNSVWKKKLWSKSIFYPDDKLILPEDAYHSDLQFCDLIILEDINDGLIEEKNHSSHIQFLSIKSKPQKFQIFKLNKAEEGFELHLDYRSFEVGKPKRMNFKICNLDLNTPIEVRINGKFDHSFTRGMGRTYIEQYFIFHLIGATDQFELKREPFDGFSKVVPKPQKVIDLMKRLY